MMFIMCNFILVHPLTETMFYLGIVHSAVKNGTAQVALWALNSHIQTILNLT